MTDLWQIILLRPLWLIGVPLSLLAGVAVATQNVDQRVMHDLDDLLAGGDGFGDRLTGGLILYFLDEIAGDREGDVGLEKGDADLAQGGFDVILGEGTLLGQPVEDTGQAFGEIFKHMPVPF